MQRLDSVYDKIATDIWDDKESTAVKKSEFTTNFAKEL